VAPWKGRDVGDFGCGYEAALIRRLLPEVASATVVDVAIAPDLKENPKVRTIEGVLPDMLSKVDDSSLDVVLCVAVLEHLWEPEIALREFHRILRPGGVGFFTVPTWLDKWPLEFSAFKLGLSPAEEMNDHKRYYSPKDFWPMLVRAGFLPQDIRCRRHKFRLHTYATVRKRAGSVGFH